MSGAEGRWPKPSNGIVEASVTLSSGRTRHEEGLAPGYYVGITSMLAGEPSMLRFKAETDAVLVRVHFACLNAALAGRDDLAEKPARIIRARRERAQNPRLVADRPTRTGSLQAIVRRAERSLSRAQ